MHLSVSLMTQMFEEGSLYVCLMDGTLVLSGHFKSPISDAVQLHYESTSSIY